MRGFFLGFLLAAALCVPYAADAAPRKAPVTAVTEGGFAPLPDVATAIRGLDVALAAADMAAAEAPLGELRDWKGRLSAQNLYFVSDYLLARAYAYARGGDTSRAVAAARMATAISPDHSQAWLTLAKYQFKHSPADYGQWLTPLQTSAKAYFADPLSARAFGYNMLALAVFSVMAAFALFCAVVAAAYYRPLVQDLRRLFPLEAEAKAAAVALALLLLALAAGLGIFAAVFALPLLLAGYLNWRGRLAVLAFTAFFAALPLFGDGAAKGVAMLSSSDARAADRFITGGFEPDDLALLEAALARNPADTRLMYMVGAMNRRLGQFDKAAEYLTRAIKFDAKNVPALVEMGNLHFDRQEYRDAEIMYKNALGLAPSSFEAHFNLSAACLEQFRTEESNAELDAASKLDAARANALIAAKDNKFAPRVVSVRLHPSEFPASLEAGLDASAADIAAKTSAFFLWSMNRNTRLIFGGAYCAAFIAAIVAWGLFGGHALCSSCGATFMPMFSTAEKGTMKCNQCVALASPKKSMAGGLKARKTKEILDYLDARRGNANMLNMLFPGLGAVWAGSYLAGAFCLVFTSAFWVNIGAWAAFLAAGYRPAPPFVYGAALSMMAVYYLAALPFLFRSK